jgi:hypothetical protein
MRSVSNQRRRVVLPRTSCLYYVFVLHSDDVTWTYAPFNVERPTSVIPSNRALMLHLFPVLPELLDLSRPLAISKMKLKRVGLMQFTKHS